MRKRLYLLLAFLWMGVCMLSAQTKNVSGRILSAENDEPIAGATVLVKGTSIGVASDAHGHFTLKVPESATELIVSFMGMETQEVGIKANLTIRLKSANEKLDEVMVVAYGTAKKSSFTGAAEVIKNEQLEKMNVVSVTKALEGTSPGLQVMGGTGQPGSGATVRIRGIGSLSSSSAPLYVLNGVVFDGDISSINPDDIESISVLKDAASAALYGARGANGVIMIQTKKGNAEKSTLSVKAVWGFSSRAIPEYSRIGIKDYYETSWEAYRNALVGTGQSMEKASEYAAANLINKQLGGYNNYNIPADKLISADGKVDASARLLYHDNWGDALFRTGLKQDYMLSMSGGSDKTTYYLSLGWLDEEGIMTRTDYQRFTARANINSQFTDWFNLEGNMGYTNDKSNQLMQAVNNGMQYGENTDLLMLSDENIAQLNTESLQDSIAQTETDTTSQLFVLPAFLDMALHTNAKRIDFKDLELENVVGEIVLRDQSINLSKLNIQSNMGNGNLTMVYRAKNGQEATAGLDLDMEDVKVEKLIALFPSIDTLVPMLRSFEGVLDCQVTATCKMDSTMSLIMPSINSSCYLHGNNMVLLDGETFTEISKTLMFKNKKRNMIDSISVDLAIKDNKIEVFPFLVEMDRYKVAVGGTHNLDMTFNYHLSVLKSPVPFKLGIDITGNLDDFKYKITKCKYKDIFKPAKQAELDSTRKNIRKDIRDAVRKQIEEAAPELGKDLALVKAADVWEP